jgi:CRP/FNR family transcriptional regulator, nitrogen oxide reductase regulator
MTGSLDREVLSSVLFRGFSPEARSEILRASRMCELAKGDVLFRQGEPAVSFYLVASGRIKLSQLTAEGQEVIIRFLGAGELFAGVVALERSTYPATAYAAEPTRLHVWSKDVLEPLFGRFPGLRTNIMQTMAQHMQETLSRVRELSTERVPQRIARTLLRLARQAGRPVEGGIVLDQLLSRQELAEMTGTTLYTVSRVLSHWQAAGIVQAGRERILIKAPPRLRALAEDEESAGK